MNSKRIRLIRLGTSARFIAAFAVLCCLPAYLLFHFGASADGLETVNRDFRVMGGLNLNIKLRGAPDKVKQAVEAAYQAVAKVDALCNRFDNSSELARLNATAREKPFHCDPLLWNLLLISKRYYELTDGEFDISATPFTTLWGFHRKRKTLPTTAEIAAAAKRSGLDKVSFDMKKHTVRFLVAGMALDLGGIAKGYAVGLAAKAAATFGVEIGVINLSGNAYCFPKPYPGESTYTVGIKNPLDKTKIIGTFTMVGESVATSGNYERYVVINNKHYTHIMNPKTGRPVENMLSVTVVTPKGVDSDALSTSIFIKGAKFAEKIIREFPRTSILIISRNPKTGSVETHSFGNIWNLDD